jgi:isoleucyl-tRNA synthetase
VLVLLNVVQDQSMKDEGLAREAINLVQKLRKEAHVTPSDAVSVYFEVLMLIQILAILQHCINFWLF